MGLGNLRTVRALQRLILLENPMLVFLIKTWLKYFEMQKVRIICGFEFCQIMEFNGTRGLTLFWNDNTKVNISSFSLNHIRGSMLDEENDHLWYFQVFMGSLRNKIREECGIWSNIYPQSLGTSGSVLGNLMISCPIVKNGGRNRLFSQLN